MQRQETTHCVKFVWYKYRELAWHLIDLYPWWVDHIHHFCTRITDLMYGFAQTINCCHGWQTWVRGSNHYNPISVPQHTYCYHSDRPHSFIQQSVTLSKTTTNNSGMSITVVEVDSGLINKYHMRPVLTFPVLKPVCLQAVATVMIWSHPGASVWISWVIFSRYKMSLDHANKDPASNSPNELQPNPGS